ncbi:MAG: hypothetical protein V3W41_09480 [Planctomycetota bacterium]
MQTGRHILKRLEVRSRGPALTGFLRCYLKLLGLGLFLLPLAALLYRLEFGRPQLPFTGVFLGLILLAILLLFLAAFEFLRGHGQALTAAREADLELGGGERLLSAVETATLDRKGRLDPLLFRDAEQALNRLPTKRRPSRGFPWPPLRRIAVVVGLVLLILFVPAANSGRWGSTSNKSASVYEGPKDDVVKGDEAAAGEEASAGDFAGKVTVRAETDARLYLLGQEINLSLELKTLEPLPEGRRLKAVLVIDGSKRLELPLDWTLPTETGQRLEARWALKARLEEIERYESGLMSIEAYVFAAVQREDLKGPAAANGLLIQISENQERLRSKMPRSAKKEKKPDTKPRRKRPKKERPNRPPQKKKKPRAAAAPGPGEKPPEKIESIEHVIEPLFAGDQKTKRKTRIFKRDLEDAPPLPPEEKKKARDRAYSKGVEAEFRRIKLGDRERGLVRRYLDGLRPGGTSGP